MATQAEIGVHIDVSQARVAGLIRRGILPKPAGRAALNLDDCRVAYIRHLREVAAGRAPAEEGGEDTLDLVKERARLAKEQADGQAMKNAQARGKLIPKAEVVTAMQAVFSQCRTKLLALPTKAAPLVIRSRSLGAIKATLTDQVHSGLAALAVMRVEPQIGGNYD